MTTDINARGLACPQPVLTAKQAVDQDHPARLMVRVDNEAAVENVSRFLGTRGYETTSSGQGDDFTVTAVLAQGSTAEKNGKTEPAPAVSGADSQDIQQKILVFIATDRMGFGDDELGKKLMISFQPNEGSSCEDACQLLLGRTPLEECANLVSYSQSHPIKWAATN